MLHSLGRLWGNTHQPWAAPGLCEMLQLFWPCAGGYGAGQHSGNSTPTLCVWDPECSALPSRSSQDTAEGIVAFSSVFKSLCSIIIIILMAQKPRQSKAEKPS